MISDLGLVDSFLITGWTTQAIEYLSLFDVAVLCSRWEGLPLVVPEYFAAKKPVVCTKIDAVDDMIENGVNGIVVDIDNVNALANSICILYSNDDLGKNFAEKAYQIVQKKFDIKSETNEFEQLVTEI